jgi:GxxExxY protein
MWTKSKIDELTYEIVGAAIEVHRELGPGLKEAVYEEAMCIELDSRNIRYASQYYFRPSFKGQALKTACRCDLLVEEVIVAELKSASMLHDIDRAQTLNYINLLKLPKGILLNFNVINLTRDGKETFVNDYYRQLPD